jgi:FkbM family methyltransferase
MDILQCCFEKHSFAELNNIDCHILANAFNFYMNKFNNKTSMIFDVGTNGGSFVKVLQYFNIYSNIVCFEPHPVLSKVTKEVYPYINMNNYCLGNIDGNIDIHIPKWSVGLSSTVNRPVFSQLNQPIVTLNVKCEKLDTYCELNNISEIGFIKIDVEGGEKTIFEGAKNLLKNKKILCGLFEIGQTLYDANTHENEIVALLEEYGYKIDKTISQSDYLFYLP